MKSITAPFAWHLTRTVQIIDVLPPTATPPKTSARFFRNQSVWPNRAGERNKVPPSFRTAKCSLTITASSKNSHYSWKSQIKSSHFGKRSSIRKEITNTWRTCFPFSVKGSDATLRDIRVDLVLKLPFLMVSQLWSEALFGTTECQSSVCWNKTRKKNTSPHS